MHSILALATLFLILTMTACEHTHPLADHDHHHTHDLPEHHHQHRHDTDLQALHEKLVGTYHLRTVETTTIKSKNPIPVYGVIGNVDIEEQAEQVKDTIRLRITSDRFEIQPKQWPWPTWHDSDPDPRWHSRTVRQTNINFHTEPIHYYLIEPTNITFYPTSAHRYAQAAFYNYTINYTWDSNGLLTLTRTYVNPDYREGNDFDGYTYTGISYIERGIQYYPKRGRQRIDQSHEAGAQGVYRTDTARGNEFQRSGKYALEN